MIKSIISSAMFLLFYYLEVLYMVINKSNLSLISLFVLYSLFPMLIVLISSIAAGVLFNKRTVYIINMIVSGLIFITTYFISNVFTEDVMYSIMNNSQSDINNSVTVSDTDIGSFITTALIFIALSTFGTFIGCSINKAIKTKKNKMSHKQKMEI